MKDKLQDNMNGKICLVTGGTNGIGKATAQALARKLWDVSAEMVHLADGLPAKI